MLEWNLSVTKKVRNYLQVIVCSLRSVFSLNSKDVKATHGIFASIKWEKTDIDTKLCHYILQDGKSLETKNKISCLLWLKASYLHRKCLLVYAPQNTSVSCKIFVRSFQLPKSSLGKGRNLILNKIYVYLYLRPLINAETRWQLNTADVKR